MTKTLLYTACKTLVTKEVRRFLRIWSQTLLPPMVTMSLYFIIFGHFIGNRIGNVETVPYSTFIAPGLIMMSVITNSYANVVSSFFIAKLQRNVEEILVSPTPNVILMLGYVMGGMCRGITTGLLVMCVATFFTAVIPKHIFLTLVIIILTSSLFALMGFLNALYAKKFDDINIVPNFVLTPLTYFGGVFFSIYFLPAFWQHLSLVNPILYMVNAFRYGIIGISDIHYTTGLLLLIVLNLIIFSINLLLLNRGFGIRE